MVFQFSLPKSLLVFLTVTIGVLCIAQSSAREHVTPFQENSGGHQNIVPTLDGNKERDPLRIVVLDGSGVHDVGQLHMHTGNWGAFGSYPRYDTPISLYPSAEWPAGSGVEHLNIAGLWVGGFKDTGETWPTYLVSTSAFENEFRPTSDPIDRIYETFEGTVGGNRLPWPGADDDCDGMIDEDPLDGHDNDGDGMIDEDFAAISQQMFSSWYTDDQPDAATEYPEHQPMGLKVRQESYQWTDPRFDDFVGASFTITNTGLDNLKGIYTGFLLDFDSGSAEDETPWEDLFAYWEGTKETELGPASIQMVYLCNKKNGEIVSYMAIMLLGHTISADGITAPSTVKITSFHEFSGDKPFENGGDPNNDFQRYELMSSSSITSSSGTPSDVRGLINTGDFELGIGESIEYDIGFVCGATFDELLDNAARCQRFYDGLWFDIDHDPTTGESGRETQVHWILERPMIMANLDIKPGSCPNPFNMKVFDFLTSGNPHKGGVLPVAIIGNENFNVRDIDLETVTLEEVKPLKQGCAYEDVSAPLDMGSECGCAVTGPDGYDDLVLKFSKQKIAEAMLCSGLPEAGQNAVLVMKGNLYDGTPFEATDCILFVGPTPGIDPGSHNLLTVTKTCLYGASPNPFNPSTTLRYEIALPGRVTLIVYDISGRLVRSLVDREMGAGHYEAIWDGRSESGSKVASGIYFYKLSAPGFMETKKLVLLK
ncbi:MAG: T9SS type A sorting domain-containing protein [Candidatus Krumholzibacteriota bacterium]|nr:T9SS type A sorting domain-containing protein [Candidatus Krumholzibacteriota bacterium]